MLINSRPRSNPSANRGGEPSSLSNLPPLFFRLRTQGLEHTSTSRERKGLVLFSGDLYSLRSE